jgi:hypothetical protein
MLPLRIMRCGWIILMNVLDYDMNGL